MANLRDVRLRMRAINQTLQVTKAMNLISTAKLRKGRRILVDTGHFLRRILKSMFDILSGINTVQSEYFRMEKPSSRTVILVITSDKGLAGGYNANIFHYVDNLCSSIQNPILIIVGAVGYRHYVHTPYKIVDNFSFHSRVPTIENAEEISDHIISQFRLGLYDKIHIVYTQMHNAVKLMPAEMQILPLKLEKIQSELYEAGDEKRIKLKFEYIPSAEVVFNKLVPQYIKGLIYCTLVEAYASEQSARMKAMDEASKNAEDMLASLKISYNRVRQASITQEVSEIVSGASALT